MVQLTTAADRVALNLQSSTWPSLVLEGLRPSVVLDGTTPALREATRAEHDGHTEITYVFDRDLRLHLTLETPAGGGDVLVLRPRLELPAGAKAVLNRVEILTAGRGGRVVLGDPARVRVLLEREGYGATVVALSALGQAGTAGDGEPNTEQKVREGSSTTYWLAYDRSTRRSLFAGFLSADRFTGRIDTTVGRDGQIESFTVWIDGGDTVITGGAPVILEDLRLAVSEDPWKSLELYADAVGARGKPPVAREPVVSWCSWYPYRLSVSEERVLANARIARERLRPLGLSIIEVDLGWETGYLPSSFDENPQFPHGLKWLSTNLEKLGFVMGAWKAPYTISEFDPVSKEHPEWLIQGTDGKPASYWTWFWRPHGDVYILDLTHPGAREYLRKRMESLRERGVKYFKPDFISCATNDLARRRHDPTVVAGGGTEAARLGGQVINQALGGELVLNCGGPELPGAGSFPLLYTCNDTGNTGYLPGSFLLSNYQALATHLFKNRRWGLLQPSCLCVGLPGGLEESRLRATAAVLTGGQIDISDDLTSLPEDRWQVLESCLPPLTVTAKPVDLFESVTEIAAPDYTAQAKGEAGPPPAPREHPAASIWHLRIEADWDTWDLVAVYAWSGGDTWSKPALSSFTIPLRLLDRNPAEPVSGYEFWSGQYVGDVPSKRLNPPDTDHPGDVQELLTGATPGHLELSFFGQAVKLLCLRTPRAHPWVAGTSFHQSCGLELTGVRWNERKRTLSGVLSRPAGSTGTITIAPAGRVATAATVAGKRSPLVRGAGGSLVLRVQAPNERTPWSVTFASA